MGRVAKPRRKYRPRAVETNTMGLALHRAAMPTQADRDQILKMLRDAVHTLCAGRGSELHWSIAAGALKVAKAIEERGIVRGLSEHLANAEAVLHVVYSRSMTDGNWREPALWSVEIEALRLFLDLHEYQVNQLGRAEMLAAIAAAGSQIRAEGGRATFLASAGARAHGVTAAVPNREKR